MDKEQINKDQRKKKRSERRSRSRDKKQHKDKIKQSIKRREFVSSRSISSSSSQRRKKSKYAQGKKSKHESKKQKKYLTSFESGSEKQKKSYSRSRSSRSRSRSRDKNKQRQSQTYKKQANERTQTKKERPKINGSFLSSLIVGHKVTNRKLDEIDIAKTSEKLQKNFNETRRPVTMSQYLSNQTLRIAPINRQQNKTYVCELQKCLKQFACIQQFQKHIQRHKQQF